MASCSSRGRCTDERDKKTGRRRSTQQGQEHYIEHRYKDMLFLILPDTDETDTEETDTEETNSVVKRVCKTKVTHPSITTDWGWGSAMPHEIIHKIFQLVVDSEGAVPTLCRLAQVCRLWRQVASSPDLWQRVSVSHCWKIPNKKCPPKIKDKIKKTIKAVIQERLSQVLDFSLHHWNDNVPLVLESLSSFCPLLTSLTLSHCSKVTADALVSVGECCPQLTTLNLQDSQVCGNAVSPFLRVRGASLRCLYLSYSSQTNNIINLLARGSCPELRVLDVNILIKERETKLRLPVEGLQAACPKLEVLRLLNVYFSLTSKFSSSTGGLGFRCLQELCIATCTDSSIHDSMCKRLLRDCTQLKILDLRGSYMLTPECISVLPCPDLECLYLGIHCSSVWVTLPSDGCGLLTRRWQHSLQELDLTAQRYSESDMSQGLEILSRNGTNDTLQSLNLSGTKVTAAAVRHILSSCPALTHVDLTSCRNIPRGLKCVYRGLEDVRQCLKTLCTKMQEMSGE
ncbi:F-box/LRR-repeat protein 6-like [Eleutherodactylus coqui]|uniref:F-box/LRR-repeat protein 6-like n=1 Tax=Eleutherodactylus coqui TaxID=57060 RepID=UPI003462944D